MPANDHIANCGRPTEWTDDDLFAALDRMTYELAVLKVRFAEVREARICPRCRRNDEKTLRDRHRVHLLLRLAEWARALWP